MSYALGDFDLGFLTLNGNGTFLFDDPFIRNDQWSQENPAHMRIMNNSQKGLYITTLTSGDSFWLTAGDTILIELAPNERGLRLLCQSDGGGILNKLWCTYFTNREDIAPLENSQAPPEIIKSGLAETSGGLIEWGIPTSGLATAVSTTGLNANQVRYAWMKVEYPVVINAHQFEVTTAPASNANVRIGIYQADSTCQPIGSILYDSGNIAVASGFTGKKTTTGLSLALPSAVYLVAINIDVNMSMRAVNCGTPVIDDNMGANALVQKVVANQTFGAFPSPGTLWTTTNTGSSGMQHSIVWQWTE